MVGDGANDGSCRITRNGTGWRRFSIANFPRVRMHFNDDIFYGINTTQSRFEGNAQRHRNSAQFDGCYLHKNTRLPLYFDK